LQLVIHVGDLRYRGEDNWKSWEEDFFKPAEKLLKAAPWIVVRGNHDNCHNGKGKGWLFFFEPSFAGGTKCEDSKASNALKPYAIDPSDDLRFVVLNSANARYKCNTWLQKFKNFENDLSQLFPQKTDEKHGKQFWLLTHYPIWRTAEADDTSCRSDNDDIHSTDRYRWSIVDTLDNRLVHAVLSGDTHHFEFIGEGNPVRLHVVAGNGGTYLEGIWDRPRPRNIRSTPVERERIGVIRSYSCEISTAGVLPPRYTVRRCVNMALC
jgi:predicted phosphodiesterase